jgi:glycosyltransferase involved in cell wall biosynthesis
MKQKLKTLKNKIRPLFKKQSVKTIAVCAAQVPFRSGGAEEHVNSLILELKKRGYLVQLISIPFKWYPHSQLFNSMKIWELLDLSESDGQKIDLVISTKFPSYFIRHPNKVLWLIHQYRQAYDLLNTPYTGFDLQSRKQKQIWEEFVTKDTLALSSYKRIYTNAKNTSNRLKRFNNIDSTPLYHPPGNHKKFFTAGYEDFILSAGRLDQLKRVELLIKSLKFTDKRIKCKIAGTGSHLAKLKKIIRNYDVSDRVELLGYVSDQQLLELYSRCAFVFFSPFDEDYGYITLESFLSKKPIVTAFDSGGPLEFVENNLSGIILRELSEKYIALKLEELFFDRQKCRQYGEHGYRKVMSINWDQVINTLLGDYK